MSGEPAWSASSTDFTYSPGETSGLGVKQLDYTLYVVDYCCGMWRVPMFNAFDGKWICNTCKTDCMTQPVGWGIPNQLSIERAKIDPKVLLDVVTWMTQWFDVDSTDVSVTIDYKD